MTMLGRGKRSAPQKDKGPRKDGAGKDGKDGGDKSRNAAEQATKAEEAAEAARLAEEAADRAREAARLAQIAADEAAAEADEPAEAEESGEGDAPAKAENAARTAVKPRRTKKAPEVAPEDGEPAADESAPSEDAEKVAEVETGAEPETDETDDAEDGPEAKATETEAEPADDVDDTDAAEDADAAENDDDQDDQDEDDDEPKRGRLKKRLTLKKTAKVKDAADVRPRRPLGTGRFALLAVAVVLFLGFGTSATLLVLKDHKQNATDDARKDGLWAASKAAQELSSYDFRTIDTDTKSAASMTTGKLHDDYVKNIPAFKQKATAQQLVGTTTVMKTGAISASPDKVVALVYADRSSATKDTKTQQLPESLRLKMTMVKVDGKWLAQRVDVID